ncbi:MAG: replicative DNA helicase [Chloroflexi bacterium]|nr:replicative DNA helicase [Chloroflexota bacterium]
MALSRLPPQNIEAEQSVLGSLLIDADAVIKVSPFLRPTDFYRESHQTIYQAVLDLHERRQPADLVTLNDELERRGQLEQVGGPAYLASLASAVPSPLYVEHYGRIVERVAVLRRLINAAGEIASLAYSEAEEVDEIIDRAEQIIFGVAAQRVERDLVPIQHVLDAYYDRIEFLYQHRGSTLGLPTGFVDLDKLLGGLQTADLIIVAGRPGMGKSSLCLSLAHNVARQTQEGIAIFSLEMPSEQVVQRLISGSTNIESQRLRTGRLDERELEKVFAAMGQLSELNVFIDDVPGISPMELRAKARRMHAEHKLALIIVDYLQLMRAGIRAENRVQEVSYISRQLKALARELRVPVIAVSQLSRAVELRHDKRPILSDLRESGSIEQDADVVIFIYREGETAPADVADVLVAKHRNGPTGQVQLVFLQRLTKFVNAETQRLEAG